MHGDPRPPQGVLSRRSSPVHVSIRHPLPAARSATRVFLPCSGLGRQRRGFETFTLECAEALHPEPGIDLTVFAGGPVAEWPVRVLRNLPRDSVAAMALARLHGRGSYYTEQATFFLSLVPHLVRERPDVVYFADLNLGNLCWHFRRATGLRYRLLYYNGGLSTMPFTRSDFVQQLTPAGLAEATARGEDLSRMTVLPHGVRLPSTVPPRIIGAERAALGLPVDRPIVLSVGLLDREVKRMDYLIREVAALPAPRPFLCLLGAESTETAEVRALATALLGESGVMLATVPHGSIGDFYRAADVFALCSLREGFGLAYVEALGHGLDVVAHATPVTRFILGDQARLVDLARTGVASLALAAALAAAPGDAVRHARHAAARARFGWDALRGQYAALLTSVAAMAPLDSSTSHASHMALP